MDLRTEVRRLIAAGELPNRLPDTLWGGPGTGVACCVCHKVISPREIELEFEYVQQGRKDKAKAIFHRSCYGVLREELGSYQLRDISAPHGEDGRRGRAGL